ncbi:MAG: methyltransferase domain-containing protein [Deltaproteobacteria bacterium]|nr:methyltransferase domain-containing protein [Deltaproteobacteria bacterium]
MSKIEWNPGKIMEISGFYWKTCALHAGIKTDLFTVIGNKGIKSEDAADKIKANKDGVYRLLNALTAMDLLEKKGGFFFNTEASKRFLSKDSDSYLGYMILHHHYILKAWADLDSSVKTGKPVKKNSSFADKEQREAFIMGMYNTASGVAPSLVKEFDLSGYNSLLDLGGGPGTYAIHFCLNNPKLKAAVYDLPTTKPFAEKTIAKFGLKDRISFIKGDFVKEDITGEYDVVWMSHILHGEGEEDCRKIIKKAAKVLKPGGIIMIHEFILKNSKDAPLFPALFSLNMLVGTDNGKAYSEDELEDMLKEAGLKDVSLSFCFGVNESRVMTGKKG